MKSIFTAKKILIAAALAATTAVGVATAGLTHETEWVYYDDNGNVVGHRLFACNGRMYTSGTITSNFTVSSDRCFGDF